MRKSLCGALIARAAKAFVWFSLVAYGDTGLNQVRVGASVLAARARRVTSSQFCAASAALGVSHDPPTHTTFGSARKLGAVSAVMPPVGQNLSVGNGPLSACSIDTPPACCA